MMNFVDLDLAFADQVALVATTKPVQVYQIGHLGLYPGAWKKTSFLSLFHLSQERVLVLLETRRVEKPMCIKSVELKVLTLACC
ncbi:hypothetical protein TNCV_4509021 [Trichonephila clavipes]|nr:hypothetical protein TNCV_4509021 [Trichonephila clavipes]